jgi:hypothetical protein
MGMNDHNGWTMAGEQAGIRTFDKGPLRATVSIDDDRWHLELNHSERAPTIEEIIEARDHLLPDYATHVLVLPRIGTGTDPQTFHLWETRDPMIHGR